MGWKMRARSNIRLIRSSHGMCTSAPTDRMLSSQPKMIWAQVAFVLVCPCRNELQRRFSG
eukprot:scaffold112868_cov31-Tisochrysis_lutea.AAC.6